MNTGRWLALAPLNGELVSNVARCWFSATPRVMWSVWVADLRAAVEQLQAQIMSRNCHEIATVLSRETVKIGVTSS